MEIIKPNKLREFDNHELVVKLDDPEAGLKGFIAIHWIDPEHPALGATRFWRYGSETEALRDALRLARLMSFKSALAGLPYTGAKGVLMVSRKALKNRKELFRRYGECVKQLQGKFVTGTDVGVDNEDLKAMEEASDYIIGQGVDTGYFTAIGVMGGIQEALRAVFGSPETSQKSFAIQGLGKTGLPLLKFLSGKSSKIYISDISPKKIRAAKLECPEAIVTEPDDIHKQDADVFCPCALSRALNKKTIPALKCRIVAGSANNQLESDSAGEMLHKRGILYAPDFVINAGGIISVADQYENGHQHSADRVLAKLTKINDSLSSIFAESRNSGKATNSVVAKVAEDIINKRKQELKKYNG